MKIDKSKKILIVGLGLLGGSYAKSLTKQGYYVTAITLEQASVDYAVEHNIITKGSAFVDEALIAEADIIVFALYPHVFVEWIKENGHLITPKTVITDVTGVKECIVYEIQSLLPDGVEFISAHPMAGRETSGVENADDGMFKNANYIVVPTEKNSLDTIELCGDLGETLGFREISVLSPEKHDQMIAFLSQLTHCIAVSLMCACDAPDLERYTGDSFRDLTRIANINDEMWSELFLSNKQTLLQEMDKYRNAFDKLYDSINNGNREELRRMMQLSTARRKKFNKKKS
ncbi:MAG: prephenate dehydrogenase [Clostridia bacterium]|nr:prephenate dehydrogenase [Clostridia bacterium]